MEIAYEFYAWDPPCMIIFGVLIVNPTLIFIRPHNEKRLYLQKIKNTVSVESVTPCTDAFKFNTLQNQCAHLPTEIYEIEFKISQIYSRLFWEVRCQRPEHLLVWTPQF